MSLNNYYYKIVKIEIFKNEDSLQAFMPRNIGYDFFGGNHGLHHLVKGLWDTGLLYSVENHTFYNSGVYSNTITNANTVAPKSIGLFVPEKEFEEIRDKTIELYKEKTGITLKSLPANKIKRDLPDGVCASEVWGLNQNSKRQPKYGIIDALVDTLVRYMEKTREENNEFMTFLRRKRSL